MTTAERMVPSVEDAREQYAESCYFLLMVPDPDTCSDCLFIARETEAASVALDLAVAAAHPAVREPSWRTVVEDVAV